MFLVVRVKCAYVGVMIKMKFPMLGSSNVLPLCIDLLIIRRLILYVILLISFCFIRCIAIGLENKKIVVLPLFISRKLAICL